MDDVKDKMKGFMKKVNNSFTSSSPGKFKGQGRVLGSASSQSSGTTNPIPSRPSPVLDSNQNKSQSNLSSSRPVTQRPSSDFLEKKVDNGVEMNVKSNENGKSRNGFDPFDSLITSAKRNPNGYDLKVVDCPVCGRGFGSEDEVSGHIEDCLSFSGARNEEAKEELQGDDGAEVVKSELDVSVGEYISGNPLEVSKDVILKLLKNVVKEPENAKFRKIRLGNPKIKEAIGDVVGAVELLECVGFKLNEDGGEMWAVMEVASDKQLGLIKDAISLLEPRKVEELPSRAPAKADEPHELKDIDRQVPFL